MEKTKELISLHVGQAGVQTGNALWELYCLEHGILPNGQRSPGARTSPYKSTVFATVDSGAQVPRTVLADLEPTVIDEIKSGVFRKLFNPLSMVTGKEDASSNFARGYYNVGNQMSEVVMERLRHQAEACDHLQGFMVFRSFGGGTGSGLSANLMTKLDRDFLKKDRFEVAVYPSPQLSPVIVEPYNAVLTAHSCMHFSDCCLIVDNEALYDICANQLEVPHPTYTSLNRLIAQMVAGVTSSMRFPGGASTSLDEMKTNLIPYPRLHFPLVSMAPIMKAGGDKVPFTPNTIDHLVMSCFAPEARMVKCDTAVGQVAAATMLFRGKGVSPAEINEAVGKAKDKLGKMAEFSPTGIMIAVSNSVPVAIPGGDIAALDKSVVMLTNTSAIRPAWQRLVNKFRVMYAKRAFVHHYVGEGMEEAEFKSALDDIMSLDTEYAEY